MTGRLRWAALAISFLGLATTAASCDDGGDLAKYCADYRELADNNPFLELDVASPGEIGTAFGDLRDASQTMKKSAPDSLERLADDYADAVESVMELLEVAEFDPRNLDTSAYRRATIDYEAAATALANETRARCE